MSGKNKKLPQKTPINYIDLLYMTSSEVHSRDISNLLKDTPGIKVELWEELNILELELTNHSSVDFESIAGTFHSPSDAAFVKNRNIKTIFAVHLDEQDFSMVTAIFEKIINKFSGFLCADSEDFQPVYVGSSKI